LAQWPEVQSEASSQTSPFATSSTHWPPSQWAFASQSPSTEHDVAHTGAFWSAEALQVTDGYVSQLLATLAVVQPESSGTPAIVPQRDMVQVASERVPWQVLVLPQVLAAR
jgi:hypothetical protein